MGEALGLSATATKGTSVTHERLPDGYAGYTDGENVFLDDRLNAEQMLCTLLHEMVHLELGHKGHQPEAVEMQVRYEVARRLVPLDRLGTCKDAATVGDAAKKLGVTRQVLMDRATCLSDSDAAAAGCLSCRKCPAMQFRFPANATN